MKENTSNHGFISIAFFASLFCSASFHEYISCILSVLLSVWLLVNHLRRNCTKVYFNLSTLTLTVLILFYGLSVFYAVDPGMAFIGFLKYLPLPLFALGIMQSDERKTIIDMLPYAVAIMAVLSALLAQIPLLSDYFLAAGRLSGFLQYPNTFAILILVAELLLLTKERIRYYDAITIAFLVAALIYTGSRTALVIAIPANIAALLFTKSKRFIFYSVLALLGGGFIATVFLISTNNSQIINNIMQISFRDSGLTERLLYYYDAFPVILKHPFGLGYMGYYYMQPSFQTGMYSTVYVHNDLLQLMLDVGWLPALLFVLAVFRKLFGKRTKKSVRIVLATLLVHGMLDFDLQFITLFFVYLLFLDLKAGKEFILGGKKAVVCSISSLLACVSLYMGIALVMFVIGETNASYAMYPYNVTTETALLAESDDIDRSNEIAEALCERNEYVPLAYTVRARHAYKNGDFAQLIKLKNQIFEKAPFVYDEYEEYVRMLINGVTHCRDAGDEEMAKKCVEELKSISDKLSALPDRISPLGKLVDEQPEYSLPQVLVEYIASYN